MRCKENSVVVEELTDAGLPYKLWSADLFACEECGAEFIAGFARLPLAESWQPTYAAERARLAPIIAGRCRAS